jgi:small subunit ribosomal protein S8
MIPNDPVADMLTRIRNGQAAHRPSVEVPHSRMKESVANILKREGYISDVAVEGAKFKKLTLKLKYQGKRGVIEGLRRRSSPGLREYVGAREIPRVRGGLGTAIVSTSEGLMTGVQARQKNLGGELLCFIW